MKGEKGSNKGGVFFPIFSAKMLYFFSRLFSAGRGSTWPGEIALRIRKDFVRRVAERNRQLKTVFVIGTNGKTTSSKLLAHVLRKSGTGVFSNDSGANLLNGVASALIKHANLSGRINEQAAVFEIDENALPHVVRQIRPSAILALDLFRDQLDRYGEVDAITARWKKVFAELPAGTILVLNGQDPAIFYLGQNAPHLSVHYFGLPKETLYEKSAALDADSVFCPNCSARLHFSALAYSHIGIFRCPKCGLDNSRSSEDLSEKMENPLRGLFNRYNLSGAMLAAEAVFGISPVKFARFLEGFRPSFGRQEKIEYQGRNFILQLSKNPVGFNRSLDLLEDAREPVENVLVILNDNIPDGRDVSWIWDVEFERLIARAGRIWVSGLRAYDLAVRLKYAVREVFVPEEWHETAEKKILVEENMDKMLEKIMQASKPGDTINVLPVYSAMLALRKKLSGKTFK